MKDSQSKALVLRARLRVAASAKAGVSEESLSTNNNSDRLFNEIPRSFLPLNDVGGGCHVIPLTSHSSITPASWRARWMTLGEIE
ncbi:MAG: hypothetical protein KF860_13650 [Cyclobacteriaceae bacterium]|nr:hypothetical protein [Cyclobacteriaceae bacterium]